MKKVIEKHADKLRFGAVGLLNTGIDFGLLFILVNLAGVPSIASNYISTSAALTFSFFANKKFTFRDNSSNNVRQMILFLIVTLFGLWALQPVVIWAIQSVLLLNNDNLTLLIGKLIATLVSLIWNYLMYSRLVFKKAEL